MQRNQRHAVFTDLVVRLGAQIAGQGLALDRLGLVQRQIRRGNLELATRTAPHRLALFVEHAHGDDGRGAAIGRQSRTFGVKNRSGRCNRVMNGAGFAQNDFPLQIAHVDFQPVCALAQIDSAPV